jgi:AcrR family transcriptional regulator
MTKDIPAAPPKPVPPKPVIAKTKRQIMHKAAELFAERGFGGVGISEVGDVAGLGKGALYYHIGSKEELLFDIMTDYMLQLNTAGAEILQTIPGTQDRVAALSASFMDTMFANRPEMTVCFREVHSLGSDKRTTVHGLHADYQRIWERCFAEGAAAGQCHEVPRLQTKALLGMYFYSFLWVRTDGTASSADIARTFCDIVLGAIGIADR